MPRPGVSRAQDQINILLKFPLEQQLGSDTVAALESTDRYARREALRHVEAHEPDYRPHGEDVVRRVCARISAKAPLMAVASEGSGVHFISVDDLDPGVGPPEGVPIYNPYTGVLSVYPESTLTAEEAVFSIQEAVADDDAVEGTEPIAIYRAIAALDATLEAEPETTVISGAAGDFSSDNALWTTAALQVAAAGEMVPWGLEQIGALGAWRRGYSGQGIIVAVVDTGIGPHVDIAPPLRGATFVPGSTSHNDDHGHGTHVAGTIAARQGNGIGVAGVAPLARLLAVKVLARDGYSRGDSVAHGVTWAANNGARVINLSLGSPQASDSMRRAVIYARSRNVIICAAAGNDYGGPVSYPAAFDDTCLAVAATDQSNRRATFSNRGPQLDISAPGVMIRSTYLANSYRELNGTSMATPHVAGVCAIVLSQHPEMLPLALQRHLEATAMPLGAPDQYGRGLVHAERAITAAVRTTSPQIVPTPANSDADMASPPASTSAAKRQRANR
ncbi:S8 family serine peptidase [Rhizobium johnstonii]|uniref:S8 family peptidase n=1 Tax=Rhizobium johnstonii TaxID=3019933 RepID=UPI003F9A6E32